MIKDLGSEYLIEMDNGISVLQRKYQGYKQEPLSPKEMAILYLCQILTKKGGDQS